MSQIDFIVTNVKITLENEGFTAYIAENCARQASRDWSRSTGVKGSMFDHLLVGARKTANQMKKAHP